MSYAWCPDWYRCYYCRKELRRLMEPFNRIYGRTKVVDTGKSVLVQQHFKDEVDTNTIVRRFGVTGQLPNFMPEGVYGDFTNVEDYESAVAAIERAQEGFMRLPAEVRERFNNDPGLLIKQAQSMSEDEFGDLVFPKAPPEPLPTPPVPAPAPGPVS